MHNNDFETLLLALAAVYAGSDPQGLLGKQLVPVDFYEPRPDDIARAYEAHTLKNPESATTSISVKLNEHKYTTPYALFHDIKLVCGAEITKHDVGTEVYAEIDRFYRSSTDLLLREVNTIGVRFFEAGKSTDADEDEDEDELLELFKDDFEKISRSHFASNGEFVTLIHKYTEPAVPLYHSTYNSQTEPESKPVVQPLFSGLVGRSIVDPRNTVVPDPWLLAKAVDVGVNLASSCTIKTFNSISCRIPLPSQAAAQVLDSFFHPNWYTIESPKWLQYKHKTLKPALNSTLVKNCDASELRVLEKKSNLVSLGPVVDLRNSVLSDDLKLKIWYSNLGRKQVAQISESRDVSSAANAVPDAVPDAVSDAVPDAVSDAVPDAVPDAVSDAVSDATSDAASPADASTAENGSFDSKVSAVEDGKHTTETEAKVTSDMDIESRTTSPAEDTPIQETEIMLENLVRFIPEAVSSLELLKDDKAKIAKWPHEIQKVISLNLLKLNKLRQERYMHGASPSIPSLFETLLYKKTVKLLALLARSDVSTGKQLLLQLSKKIPVLMNDYQGVLPGPIPMKSIPANKSGRLAGIKGPHKKKGRFL